MKIGIMMFPTETSARPEVLARALEERGFDSMFLPEHTHIPVTRRTPYPAGGELPPEYFRTIDPFIGLALAAAATSKLLIGTGLCLPAQHDPIVLAKTIATLDRASDGRLLVGIGFGWNADEVENHGVAFSERREVVRESVKAMQSLWTEEVGSFKGAHVNVEPSWSWPKPAQSPHPPIFIGGAAGPKMFDHVSDFAQGWAPIGASAIETGLPGLQAAFERSGRDPATIRLMPFDTRHDRRTHDRLEKAGAERVVINIPPLTPDEMFRKLDHIAAELEITP